MPGRAACRSSHERELSAFGSARIAPALILGAAPMAFLIAWSAGAQHAISLADYCPQ